MAKVVVRVAPKKDPEEGSVTYVSRSQGAKQLDVRDHIAELVGRGNSMSPRDRAAIYGSLSSAVGEGRAKKIMDHAYIFNQRPDVLKLPVEDKLRSFYSIGANDPDVNDILTKSKAIGYGILPGFRESASGINQVLAGRIPASSVAGMNNY